MLLIFCALMTLTYVYLIRRYGFPKPEYLNAALLTGNGILRAARNPTTSMAEHATP